MGMSQGEMERLQESLEDDAWHSEWRVEATKNLLIQAQELQAGIVEDTIIYDADGEIALAGVENDEIALVIRAIEQLTPRTLDEITNNIEVQVDSACRFARIEQRLASLEGRMLTLVRPSADLSVVTCGVCQYTTQRGIQSYNNIRDYGVCAVCDVPAMTAKRPVCPSCGAPLAYHANHIMLSGNIRHGGKWGCEACMEHNSDGLIVPIVKEGDSE